MASGTGTFSIQEQAGRLQGIDKVIVLAGSGTEADALDNLLYVIGPRSIARVSETARRS